MEKRLSTSKDELNRDIGCFSKINLLVMYIKKEHNQQYLVSPPPLNRSARITDRKKRRIEKGKSQQKNSTQDFFSKILQVITDTCRKSQSLNVCQSVTWSHVLYVCEASL